ncbi:MAG: hypothetical protein N2423_04475 [Novosphingobium sp.]|nr:hypothetical protein [Novosphingobium sp.]
MWCLYTLLAAAPFAVAAYLVESPWAMVLLFGIYMTLILSTSSIGPAAAQVITPPELRGRVSAIFVLITGLIGMVVGNAAVGFVTDHVLGDPQLVGTSMIALIIVALAIAALLFTQGRADMRRLTRTAGA